jgi:hypothetical protein
VESQASHPASHPAPSHAHLTPHPLLGRHARQPGSIPTPSCLLLRKKKRKKNYCNLGSSPSGTGSAPIYALSPPLPLLHLTAAGSLCQEACASARNARRLVVQKPGEDDRRRPRKADNDDRRQVDVSGRQEAQARQGLSAAQWRFPGEPRPPRFDIMDLVWFGFGAVLAVEW